MSLSYLRAEDEQWHRPDPPDPAEPSARCQWPINGDPENDMACGEPAYFVVVGTDELGRDMVDLECAEHLADVLLAATSCYATHPIRVSLTRIDANMYDFTRQQWLTQQRTARRKNKRA